MFMRFFPLAMVMAFVFSTRVMAGCEDEVRTDAPQYDPKKIYRPAAFGYSPDDTKGGLVTDVVPINVPNLIAGYASGLFAYFSDQNGIGKWYDPPTRGILRINKAHIGSRMERRISNRIASGEFQITRNRDFKQVIEKCATVPRATGEWISPTHVREYDNLHRAGFAHSVEVWRGDPRDNKLIGGLYFVYVNGIASGESMFGLEKYAMDTAVWTMIQDFRQTLDPNDTEAFIDTQMNIGISKLMGGEDIGRYEYRRRFREQQKIDRPINAAYVTH